MEHTKRYSARGVSSTKEEVHSAIKMLDKGLYPNAFCKILPDVAAGSPEHFNVLHADTAGTKASLAYVYWRETGDASVWAGIAQDAIVMNIDDMACVGCTGDILLSNTITRNKHIIPGEVVAAIIRGTLEFCDKMSDHGIQIHNAGGETADVGDVVRTVDVGFTAFGRISRDQLLVNNIRKGDVVVGLGSFGKATYEMEFNSGIGSNGLTSARHDVLHHEYALAYPESFSPETDRQYVYSGSRKVDELIEVAPGETMTLGKMILSPTRTFVPILRDVLREVGSEVHGLIHCTGGGLTKVSKFLDPGLAVIKDNIFETPRLFEIIRTESDTEWQEMYQVFNMGVRMEIYLPEARVAEVIDMAARYNIPAQVIGRVEAHSEFAVSVKTATGVYRY